MKLTVVPKAVAERAKSRKLADDASHLTTATTRGTRTRSIVRARSLVLFAAVLTIPLGASLASASASTVREQSHASTKPLKPDFAFFKGKTINYVVSAGVTGASYQLAAGMAPLMSAYLGATVNVEQITGDQAIHTDITGHAPPDGLTIGLASMTTYLLNVAQDADAFSFPLLSADFVGTTGAAPYAIVSCHTPTLTSFSQLLGGSTPVVFQELSTTGLSSAVGQFLIEMYNIPHTYLKSYTNTTLVPACERGDGNLSSTNAIQWVGANGTTLDPGVIPLLVTGKLPASAPAAPAMANVPLVADFVKAHPPKTALGKQAAKIIANLASPNTPFMATFTAKGTPKARVLALQMAYKHAWNTAAMVKVRANIAFPRKIFSQAEVVAWIHTSLKLAPTLNSLLSRN